MRYVAQRSAFGYTEKDYRGAMEILDQENLGKEASIDDAIRVLTTYSQLSKKEIENFLEINSKEDDNENTRDIFSRMSK